MYAKIENGIAVEYPLYEGDLEKRFPEYVFPLDSHLEENNGVLCPEGYVRVYFNDKQVFNYLKFKYELGMPVIDPEDGIWKDTWIETPYTEQELNESKFSATQIQREERNKRLIKSDVFVFSDRWDKYSEQEKLEWSDYRQALRDVPDQVGFPYNVDWPIEPVLFSIKKV